MTWCWVIVGSDYSCPECWPSHYLQDGLRTNHHWSSLTLLWFPEFQEGLNQFSLVFAVVMSRVSGRVVCVMVCVCVRVCVRVCVCLCVCVFVFVWLCRLTCEPIQFRVCVFVCKWLCLCLDMSHNLRICLCVKLCDLVSNYCRQRLFLSCLVIFSCLL